MDVPLMNARLMSRKVVMGMAPSTCREGVAEWRGSDQASQMMRCVALLWLVFAVSACSSTEKRPRGASGDWGFIEFAEVRVFRMNWKDRYQTRSIVVRGNRLNGSRMPKAGIPLDARQVALLRSAVTGVRPFPKWLGACYDPHHAFVFYDTGGDVVGHVDICFQCVGHSAAPKGFSESLDWEALSKLMKGMGVPIKNPEWE